MRQGLGSKIRYILDGGGSRIGLESTIVDLRHPERPVILRPGAITAAELERHLGRRLAVASRAGPTKSKVVAQVAPGQLARHYSPRTPVTLHARLAAAELAGLRPAEAFVYLRRPKGHGAPNVFWLDVRGELPGVARRLFATLRKLDAMAFDRIHIERAPDHGLGHAINDRLTRAAAR